MVGSRLQRLTRLVTSLLGRLSACQGLTGGKDGDEMAATMQDVADRAGVSIATVSFVVNNTKNVTPADAGADRAGHGRSGLSPQSGRPGAGESADADRRSGDGRPRSRHPWCRIRLRRRRRPRGQRVRLSPGRLSRRCRGQPTAGAGRTGPGRWARADGGPDGGPAGADADRAQDAVRADRSNPRPHRAVLRGHRLRHLHGTGHRAPGRARPPPDRLRAERRPW